MAITNASARDILTGARAGSAPASNPTLAVPITSWYLENTQPGHNKFYLCMASDAGHCVFVWGRIGSKGQSKIQKYPSHGDAETACLQQVYAKAAKGYEIRDERLKFTVTGSELQSAVDTGSHDALLSARRQGKQDPKFAGEQQTATRHYDTFITSAEGLMARIKKSKDPFSLLEEWTALQEAWSELNAKHETAATTLSLTGQMLQQQLFG